MKSYRQLAGSSLLAMVLIALSAPGMGEGQAAEPPSPVPTPPVPPHFVLLQQDDVEDTGRLPTPEVRPPVLRDPDEPAEDLPPVAPLRDDTVDLFVQPRGVPLGFTGPSSVLPTERQTSQHFVPIEDRWRMGFPEWDRYGKGHPVLDDYPYVQGIWYDPYNQNVLKGDYPIIGQHTFLNITARSLTLFEPRALPTPTTPFEATRNPGQAEFFGDPDQFIFLQYSALAFDLFHGDTAFKPFDWRLKLNLIYNQNYLDVEELGVVSPDVRAGTTRDRDDFALEEFFFETKLSDTSPFYDFVSLRAGSQPFVSDFRGFIFADVNLGLRLFGSRKGNREQYNLAWFHQLEKETNSLLNRFTSRNQTVVAANYYRQDVLYPGFNHSLSFHYNHDPADIEFDANDFPVRPDPVGIFQPHDIKAYYLGWTSNGHVERINVSHALYYVTGVDDLNPLAGQPQDINAWMGALELSYDRDWVRFRTSYFYASGDSDINDTRAEGFDSILANPNFAGGEFSFWNRQNPRLFGVELTNRLNLTPSLRSSKFQGQSNFVNPGLQLFNLGLDADITPRLKSINNVNFLWFEQTEVLETYLFVGEVRNFIGTDLSSGLEYRPLLNNNILILGGASALVAGDGYQDLFQRLDGDADDPWALFTEVVFQY